MVGFARTAPSLASLARPRATSFTFENESFKISEVSISFGEQKQPNPTKYITDHTSRGRQCSVREPIIILRGFLDTDAGAASMGRQFKEKKETNPSLMDRVAPDCMIPVFLIREGAYTCVLAWRDGTTRDGGGEKICLYFGFCVFDAFFLFFSSFQLFFLFFFFLSFSLVDRRRRNLDGFFFTCPRGSLLVT